MKNILIVSIIQLLFLSKMLNAQVMDCRCGQIAIRKVEAPSGLVLREGPSVDSRRLLAIPKGEKVLTGYDYQLSTSDDIEGKNGLWLRALYNGREGFVFDAFLEKKQLYTLYTGPENIAPESLTLPFTGVFAQNPGAFGWQRFDLREIPAERKTWPDGQPEEEWYEPAIDPRSYPVFTLTGITSKERKTDGHLFDYCEGALLPGSMKYFYLNNTNYKVFATGEVSMEDSNDGTHQQFTIRHYKVYLEKRTKDMVERQLLYEAGEMQASEEGISGTAQLQWAGDLDGDGLPDFILNVHQYMGFEIRLYLSSEAEKGFQVKMVYKMEGSCC